MRNDIYRFWQELPEVINFGLVTALAIATLVFWVCLAKLSTKPWNILLKALTSAAWCFTALLTVALLGIFLVQTGSFGMARGWSSFAEGYLWGLVLMPVVTFGGYLVAFRMLPRAEGKESVDA